MRSASVVIHSAVLVDRNRAVSDAWVRFDDGRVAARGTGDSWRDKMPPAVVTDARGRYLTPGFLDLHCHGGGGYAVEDGADAITSLVNTHTAHGTTRIILSLVTAATDELVTGLQVIAAATEQDTRVLGSHLEGPFLDTDFRGAHNRSLLQPISLATIERLHAGARGTLRQITLSPEHEGAFEAIDWLTRAGVRVAVGHTGADFGTALAAFNAGASLLTHAFNGMRGIHHRAPGPVVAAMTAPHVTLELINDGVHIHPDVVNLAFAGAPGRIALITDAMAAAGSKDGRYRLGTVEVDVRDGIARLAGGTSIAGSSLTLDIALKRAVAGGIPLPVAVAALTTTPATAIGREEDLCSLEVGFPADAVLLDADLTVAAVWVEGCSVARGDDRVTQL